jgi:hypothetical protein
MARREDLDQPLASVLDALTSVAEGVARARDSSIARDNAEAVERLAKAAEALANARSKLPA